MVGFVKPIVVAQGWETKVVQRVFMLIIGVIGVSAAFGGMLVDKKGPKFVAIMGAIFYGVGVLLGGVALRAGNFWFLLFGYGLIAGIGNGLAYVVPIATLIRWFPDKRGMITGLAVMGFGFGAFFIGMIIPGLINNVGVANSFFILGIVYLVFTLLASSILKNPPRAGFPKVSRRPPRPSVRRTPSVGQRPKGLVSGICWGHALFECHGRMGLLSKLSPMAQEVINSHRTLMTRQNWRSLVAAFWRPPPFSTGWAVFSGLPFPTRLVEGPPIWYVRDAGNPLYPASPDQQRAVFTIIACYLLACLGGAFAVMPAFAADSFGPAYIGRV
jgi:OFA family oxalate/formate antiporter-like MFS transporter